MAHNVNDTVVIPAGEIPALESVKVADTFVIPAEAAGFDADVAAFFREFDAYVSGK